MLCFVKGAAGEEDEARTGEDAAAFLPFLLAILSSPSISSSLNCNLAIQRGELHCGKEYGESSTDSLSSIRRRKAEKQRLIVENGRKDRRQCPLSERLRMQLLENFGVIIECKKGGRRLVMAGLKGKGGKVEEKMGKRQRTST
jgi:hypothetical protein